MLATDTKVDRKDPTIAAIARAVGYNRGRKFRLRPATHVTLSGTYWDGGSRSKWWFFDLATSRLVSVPQWDPPQFGGPRAAPSGDLPPGIVAVEWAIFCGKDVGLTIYARPEDMARALPAAKEG